MRIECSVNAKIIIAILDKAEETDIARWTSGLKSVVLLNKWNETVEKKCRGNVKQIILCCTTLDASEEDFLLTEEPAIPSETNRPIELRGFLACEVRLLQSLSADSLAELT